MESEMLVKKRREFGEVLTDPFKLIFRNLKAIFSFNMIYIFVPLAIGMGLIGYLQSSLVNMMDFDAIPWKYALLGIVALMISGVHTSASTFAIIKSAEEDGFENLSFDSISNNFKEVYQRNLVFFFSMLAIAILFMIVVVFLIMSVPIFGAILMFFFGIAMFFYVGPLMYLAMTIFLYNDDVGFGESFGKSRDYMGSHWGSIFGTFIVSILINMVLQYTFTIPFLLLFFVLGDASTFFEDPTAMTPLLLVQNVVISFLSSFLVQYVGMCMYFKYFDLYEHKFGKNLLDKISNIGEQETSYFDNEGEY